MTSRSDTVVYLDHAAATPLDPSVFDAMLPYFTQHFANPSGPYFQAKIQREAVEAARVIVARVLHTGPETVLFTSGGTESDNLAILGIARCHRKHGTHIVTTAIEHDAVLGPLRRLETEGFTVSYAAVDRCGHINPDDVIASIRPDTVLVSVMYANNEIGTVEPIAHIGRGIAAWRRKHRTSYPYFHTDACQAAGALPLNVEELQCDLMTLNGSKIYGPKGTGVLYKASEVNIESQIVGGGQEKGLRSGTESVAGIVGIANALQRIHESRQLEAEHCRNLRNTLWQRLKERIPNMALNGPDLDSDKRLPNNLHVSFEGVPSEALIAYLDSYGVMCAAGSACSTSSLEPSHVLMACGLTAEEAECSVRFTLGKDNTLNEIDYSVQKICNAVTEMRRL